MIIQSNFWKEDLKKTANKLFLRHIQKRWTERSIYIIEKDIFYGFFAVRKLMDSESFENKNYTLFSIPKDKTTDLNYKLDTKELKNISLNTRQICNQFIHSYHFIPIIIESGLFGFIVSSDYLQKDQVLFIFLATVVDIFSDVADLDKNTAIDYKPNP